MTIVNEPVRNNGRAAANRARTNRSARVRLSAQANKVTEDIQELGGIAGDAAQEKLEQLRNHGAEYYGEGRERVRQVERSFEQYIRQHPVKSLMIAAGIGLVLGRFWMRR